MSKMQFSENVLNETLFSDYDNFEYRDFVPWVEFDKSLIFVEPNQVSNEEKEQKNQQQEKKEENNIMEDMPSILKYDDFEKEMEQFDPETFIESLIKNVQVLEETRTFKLIEELTSKAFFKKQLSMPKDINITIKHRREKQHQEVDEYFYSSISYQLFVNLNMPPELLKEPNKIPVIVVKAKLFEENGKEIVGNEFNSGKTKKNSQAGLTMPLNMKFSRKQPHLYTSTLLVHIDASLSYFFTKKDYYMELHFYEAYNMNQAILVTRSPVFRLFARKPNKPT
eukprot:CAMPEP_0117428848 /NCGR_PEP_ID=MMETSP0758-20121206/8463_1 /TAXON_ID=63605 /ORGANISM="Percolomonas cosmopolitus, Strain AE-1 (ATCC 50343)" /LENGTH=280 /DNA_ID=CAMNT_0005215429 /DNA_START=54 /DNA_END=894 /DNA_ORIENTATION=+